MVLRIAFRIFDDLERNRFTSLFASIPARLSCEWQVVDCAQADVVLVDASEPGGEYFLNSCRSSAHALPLVYGDTNQFCADWFIQKPVRSAAVIKVLNDIAEYLRNGNSEQSRRDVDKPVVASALASGKTVRSVDQLIAHLAEPQSQYVSLSVGDGFKACIDYATDKVWIPDRSIQSGIWSDWLNGGAGDVVVTRARTKTLNPATLARISGQGGYKCFNLDQLQWMLYLMFSDGQLHGELAESSTFSLKNWPNFTHFPHLPQHVMLSAALVRQPTAVEHVAERTQLSRTFIVNFLNACHALGWLQVDGGKNNVVAFPSVQRAPVIDKILKKLFG